MSNKILDEDEIKKLTGNVTTDRDELMIKLMYGLGLRVSELVSLQWSDLNKDILTVYGKGGKTRYVKVPLSLLTAFKGISQPEGFIFLSRYGKPLSRIAVFRMIKKVAAIAGLSGVLQRFAKFSATSHLKALSRLCFRR